MGNCVDIRLTKFAGGGDYCKHNVPLGRAVESHTQRNEGGMPLSLLVGCMLYPCVGTHQHPVQSGWRVFLQ